MTDTTKPVKRRTIATVRDQGRTRRLIATLYPSGLLGLRPERCRREETITLESAWSLAVKQRIARERAEKKATKKWKK
mgnify:CR=1 FL=1